MYTYLFFSIDHCVEPAVFIVWQSEFFVATHSPNASLQLTVRERRYCSLPNQQCLPLSFLAGHCVRISDLYRLEAMHCVFALSQRDKRNRVKCWVSFVCGEEIWFRCRLSFCWSLRASIRRQSESQDFQSNQPVMYTELTVLEVAQFNECACKRTVKRPWNRGFWIIWGI